MTEGHERQPQIALIHLLTFSSAFTNGLLLSHFVECNAQRPKYIRRSWPMIYRELMSRPGSNQGLKQLSAGQTELAAAIYGHGAAPDTPEAHLHLSPLLPLPRGLFRQVNAHSLSKSRPNRRSRFIYRLRAPPTPDVSEFSLLVEEGRTRDSEASDENENAKRHRSGWLATRVAYETGGSARTNAGRNVKLAFQKEINAAEIAVLLTDRI
ncbi:Uncharacterized protein DBV15_01184 [Temnothorax longispinosus]|uniref:Uncharacterized protein n=1 Tax=Temnothorax longispinosus TaxID=300112 RepID=A0A4S2J9G2_9HYME|nr:Uncharacterized protein DBV15_01184 [Temnothorax longispinosus]